MEYVKGRDLASLVKEGDKLPIPEAVNYVLQTAVGMAYAHSRHIIHRDLKPSNLLLATPDDADIRAGQYSRVKILDIGLARLTHPEGEVVSPALEGSDHSAAQALMGIVAYMAPEQILDTKRADHRTDIYSLGCTLYFLLTKKPVYTSINPLQQISAILTDNVPSLKAARPDAPEELEAVFQKMVAKNPKDRCQSMMEVVETLGKIDRQLSGLDSSPSHWSGSSPDACVEFAQPGSPYGTKSKSGSGSQGSAPTIASGSGPVPGVVGSSYGSTSYGEDLPIDCTLRSNDRPLLSNRKSVISFLKDVIKSSWVYGGKQKKRSNEGKASKRTSPKQTSSIVPIDLGEPTLERGHFEDSDWQKKDAVDCSVFAPPTVVLQDMVLVQVFVHNPAEYQAASETAKRFDDDAKPRGTTSLGTLIKRGERLAFELCIPNFEVEETRQQLIWSGRTASVQFVVRVGTQVSLGTSIGAVVVSQGSIPIGKIQFKISIVGTGQTSPLELVHGEVSRYKQAFISYASQDRSEVLRRVQMLKAVGIRFFQDIFDLNPGDRWKTKLYEKINECDVLFLFWSTAAKQSEWVEKEWKFGLEWRGDQFIRPIVIEGPPIPSPPPELAHLHFGDPVLYFLTKTWFQRLVFLLSRFSLRSRS